MEIKEVDNIEYRESFPVANHIFNTVKFNEINRARTENVKYLFFIENDKVKMGISGGLNNSVFSSPFSAPFGGWCYYGSVEIKEMESACDLLEKWAAANSIRQIKIVLPPFFYDESLSATFFNVSLRKGFTIKSVDLNFHFDLNRLNNEYLNNVFYNARKNYKIAERNGLSVNRVTDDVGIRLAYNIIAQNRLQRGYPLRMSFDDIQSTIKVIDADFFIVYTSEDIAMAAAMVFKVTNDIVQVVYWGHNVEYSSLKPINFLSYKLFEYYKQVGFKYVDIGPSTEMGEPNYGLIEFKQSIGCEISSKLTVEKKIMHEKFT